MNYWVRLDEKNLAQFVRRAWYSCARIEEKIFPRANVRQIFRDDPKIGSSGDRSWPGTARLFPTVPACSMGWRIRHDRLDR